MPVKAVIPKRLVFDAKKMADAIENAFDGAAEGALTDFDTTHATWATPVGFTVTAQPYSRIISTDSAIYAFVNDGTRPHPIAPKKPGGVLAFRTGGGPKSSPGVIGSSGGSAGTNQVFTRKPVQHPGTKARDFDKAIAKKWRRAFGKIMQRAIDAAARR